MEPANVFTPNTEPYPIEASRFFYKSLLGRWFYVPVGYLPQKPDLYSIPKGFRLKDKLIYSLLSTSNEFAMRTTDADAILADFFIVPSEARLKNLLRDIGKPVIISIGFAYTTRSNLPDLVKKFETMGAAGFHIHNLMPNMKLEKLCLGCSVPVISETSKEPREISSKINAGVDAVCLPAKHISEELVVLLHKSYPDIPVIAACGRSEKLMIQSAESGIDAVIFKPCVPIVENWDHH